jgi:hypothetical protein
MHISQRFSFLRAAVVTTLFVNSGTSIVATTALASTITILPDPAIAGSGTSINGKDAKTDFEVVITSTTGVTITGSELKVNGTAVGAGMVTNDGTASVTITWNTPIPVGASAEWAFTGDEATLKNNYGWTAHFTPAASPTDVPSLGWDVTPTGDVSLVNAYSTPIAFSGLMFQFPTGFTIDSMLALLAGPAPGTPATIPAGTVPAAGELLVGHVTLPPGGFVTGDYSSVFVDSSFSPLTMTGGLGHQATVPEPSTASLLIIAISVGGLLRVISRVLLHV